MAKGYGGERYNSYFPGKQGMDFRSQVRQDNGPDKKPKAFTKESQEFIKAEQLVHETVKKLKQKYPEKSQREIAIIAKRELPDWLLRYVPIMTILTLILAACGATAPTPSAEVPNPSAPTTAEATDIPAIATEAATQPAEVATDNPIFNHLINQTDLSEEAISANPALQNDYLRRLIKDAGSVPNLCMPTAEGWQTSGAIDVLSNKIFLNPDGICIAEGKGENGKQFTTGIKDTSGYLTIFERTGLEMAGLQEGEGYVDFLTPVNGSIATTRLNNGTATNAVVSELSGLWTTVDGLQTEQEASVVFTPTAVNNNSEQQPVSTLSEIIKSETMADLAKETIETGIWPILTDSQTEEFFKELNKLCGLQILVFPTSNPSQVMINVPADLYPNFATEFADIIIKQGHKAPNESIQKQYGDFRDNYIIEKKVLESERMKSLIESIRQEKWVDAPRDPDTKQVSIVIDGVKMIIPGSENMSNDELTGVIDINNFKEKTQSGEFVPPAIELNGASIERYLEASDNVLVPIVLLPIPDSGLSQIASDARSEDLSYGLRMIRGVRFYEVTDGNGNTKLVGDVISATDDSSQTITFMEEGEKTMSAISDGDAFRGRKFENIPSGVIEELGLYWLMVGKSPQSHLDGVSWADELQDIVVPPFSSLDASSENVISSEPNLKETGFTVTRANLVPTTLLIKSK